MRFLPTPSQQFLVLLVVLLALVQVGPAKAQSPRSFRLDGGDTTYAFGVNERGEVQSLYWGGHLGAHDAIPAAHSQPEMASFDSPYTNTPQEFASWGAGLFTEPALKVTFADGNRDLVLHFVKAAPTDSQHLDVMLKDISREIFVTLHYAMDAESGILARSATIENRGKDTLVVEQAAAAQWSLPPARYMLSYLTGRWAGESGHPRAAARHDWRAGQSMVRDLAQRPAGGDGAGRSVGRER